MKLCSQLRALGFLALCVAARPATSSAALTTTDQQNMTFNNTSGGFGGTATTGFGQSFTPTLSTLNAATFSLATEGASSTVQLRLFSGAGYGGTLLATSAAVTFTNTALQTTEFGFPTPVALTPGTTYTFQLAVPTGSTYSSVYSDANPYAGGLVYNASGGGFPTLDFVFAEGTNSALAPEPSTWALVGLGIAGLGLMVRRRLVT